MSQDPQTELGSNLDEPAPKARAKKRKSIKAGDENRTWIVLEDNPDIPPTGLPLGHNGTNYIIMPGEPVYVPDFLLEVLDHAIVSIPQMNGNTQQVIGYRERHRFPYRRVAAPASEE
jgi:hypothetical protein